MDVNPINIDEANIADLIEEDDNSDSNPPDETNTNSNGSESCDANEEELFIGEDDIIEEDNAEDTDDVPPKGSDEESDDGSEDDRVTTTVDLAFLSDAESYLLGNRYFPSKVGGKPAWLELANLPSLDELRCRNCAEIMVFLLQLYSPDEKKKHAYHRMLYMFVCKNRECWLTDCSKYITVLRSQLPLHNEFFSPDPPLDEMRLEIAPTDMKLCTVCGVRGPFQCSKCKITNYCSTQHQRLDWIDGHKAQCGAGAPSIDGPSSFLLREYELDIDAEFEEDIIDGETPAEAEQRRSAIAESIRCGETFSGLPMDKVPLKEMLKFATSDETTGDADFNKFRRHIENAKHQVLRFDRDGEPLWVCSKGKLSADQVPKCELCGGPRSFEFQVMPQLLNSYPTEPFDWGTLVVYTCQKSCPTDEEYVPEYCYKQEMQ